MNRQIISVLVTLALILLNTSGHARPTYIGYSGAPGSQGSCASSCHGSAGGTIQVSGFPSEYYPGQTYTVTISHNGGSAIKQFNGSCRVGSGSETAGTIASGTNTATYSTAPETNGIHLSATDLDNATFSWTAPPSGTGDVTLYIAGHQGNLAGANTELMVTSTELATDVREAGFAGLPDNYRLSDNYPNPFNPTTSFEFSLPQRAHVTIEVFNVVGQRVITLTDGEYAAGDYAVTWNGKSSGGQSVSTGVYFYRLQAGDFIETKKMMLLK